MEEVVNKCLEKDRRLRYQHASDIRTDLQRLKRDTESSRTGDPTDRAPQSRLSRPALIATAGGLVLLLAVVVGLRVGRLREWLHPAAVSSIEAVAVLPLQNLSGDPAQEYFADGMTEELITELGQISALRVISRTSVMRYKGAQKPLPEIARELHVDAVVEGSVTRVRDRVRITAQLIRAPTDVHLWAASYERDLGDVLTLQHDVAKAIADEIRVKLTPQQESRLSSSAHVDPQAHDAYLRGLSYLNERTKAGIKKSIEMFRQAVAQDPQFAPAYVGLAMSYNISASYGVLSPYDAFPRAKASALEALRLEPALAEAHSELGYEKVIFEHDWTGAKEEFQRAMHLNPNSADAHYKYALSWLTPTGRHDEAIAEIRKTLELDPLSLPHNQGAVYIFYFARRYPDALDQCRKTIDLDRNFATGHWRLSEVYAQLGRYKDAISETETAWLLDGGDRAEVARWIGALRQAVARSGERGFWQELRLLHQKYSGPVEVARAYARLGQQNDAFLWLEKGFTARESDITVVAVDPAFDSLGSDPRFADLLRRIGLPQPE